MALVTSASTPSGPSSSSPSASTLAINSSISAGGTTDVERGLFTAGSGSTNPSSSFLSSRSVVVVMEVPFTTQQPPGLRRQVGGPSLTQTFLQDLGEPPNVAGDPDDRRGHDGADA